MQIDEVLVENDELLLALEEREKHREAVGLHRKATVIVKEIVAEMGEHAGKLVRCGRFTFEVVDDPGGNEVAGYETKPGIKPKKIRVEE